MSLLSIAAAMPSAAARGERAGGSFGATTAPRSRRRAAAAIVALLVALGTLAYWLLATPLYRADTMLRLPLAAASASRPADASRPNVERAVPARSAAAEADVLRSRDLLLPVITRVGADVVVDAARRWGWVPVGAHHGVESVRFEVPSRWKGRPFGLRVEGGNWTLQDEALRVVARGELGKEQDFALGGSSGRIRVDGNAAASPAWVRLTQETPLKAYEIVTSRLRVAETAPGSATLRLVYDDPEPARAAALLNAMVADYVELSTTRRLQDTEAAVRLAETQQLAPLGDRVRTAEAALAAYRKKVLGVNDAGDLRAVDRRRDDLEQQLARLEARRGQLAHLYTPRHPDYVEVSEQIASVRASLSRIVDPATLTPEQQREHGRLMQDVQSATRQYSGALDEVQHLRATAASQAVAARQLDVAAVPQEPSFPEIAVVASIGLALAVVLSLAVAGSSSRTLTASDIVEVPVRGIDALAAETSSEASLTHDRRRPRIRLDTRQIPSDEVADPPAADSAGNEPAPAPNAVTDSDTPPADTDVPHEMTQDPLHAEVRGSASEATQDALRLIEPAVPLPTVEAPDVELATARLTGDAAKEALRPVVESLDRRAGADQAQVLLLTSPSYEGGMAPAASTLASLMVDAGRSVLLVEADLRRPQVQLYLSVDHKTPGLSDLLTGDLTLNDVLHPSKAAGIDFVARGKAAGDPADLLFRPELASALSMLRQRYDRVVVHVTPLMVAGDAMAFCDIVDCAVLLVSDEAVASPETDEARRRLERAGIPLADVVPALRTPRLGGKPA